MTENVENTTNTTDTTSTESGVVLEAPKTNGEAKSNGEAEHTINVGDPADANAVQLNEADFQENLNDLDVIINDIPEEIRDTQYGDSLKEVIKEHKIPLKHVKPLLGNYAKRTAEAYKQYIEHYNQKIKNTEEILSKGWNNNTEQKQKDIDHMKRGMNKIAEMLGYQTPEVYAELKGHNLISNNGRLASPVLALLLRELGKNNAEPSEVSANASSQKKTDFTEDMKAFMAQR